MFTGTAVHLTHFVTCFVALFSIVNPIGCLPVFIACTEQDKNRVRNVIAIMMGVFIILGLGVFYLAGTAILSFFEISLPAFRIAGGIVLLLTGVKMLGGMHSDITHKAAPMVRQSAIKQATSQFQSIFIPLVFPIFVGPGSISTAIILSSQYPASWAVRFGALSAIVVVGVLTIVILLTSAGFQRVLGKLGMEICTRLFGLILVAMAVQFMLVGFGNVTDHLINMHTATSK
ncbi:MarC family protein [Poriferisphaera sp. WC338]|uniref:MarC family protein n=1 Tax=Poriferisphaera sp. WC338 TaxID=3425129 RepID=UPI003D81A726